MWNTKNRNNPLSRQKTGSLAACAAALTLSLALSLSLSLSLPVQASTGTVHFDANGGSGSMDDASLSDGDALPVSTFSRYGYIFRGWSGDPDAKQAAYHDQGTLPTGGDQTLYAVWEPQLYIIHFDGSGVTSESAQDMYAYYGTPVSLEKNHFFRQGHRFLGWIDTATGTRYSNQQNVLNLQSLLHKNPHG